ncbi:MAG: AzlD domain-containing protein [Firmicutes bacterium]|nr:AzlD domain-containing protein [Bacillota bacterium]
MSSNIMIYILVSALVSFGVRVLPLTLIRKKIENRFLRSFLYYVPYVTLAVMTFPAIIEAAQEPIAGIVALAVGIVLSWLGAGLFPVAVCCCISVFAVQYILTLF